ncbi:uncharacterized protein [Apostichopus japonicus]|uniref:uncharacterized protein n=1 Tax=Stichopus japonicus TaxID=307972 RepID=UPI003AB2DEED
MDEEFDDSSDDRKLDQQAWKNIAERRIKDGYREGVTNGQEAAIQDGFEKGFQEHLNGSLLHGFMSGTLSGLLSMQEVHGIPNLTESEVSTAREILQRLQQLKTKQHHLPSHQQSSNAETSTRTFNAPGATASKTSSGGHSTRNEPAVVEDRTEHTNKTVDGGSRHVSDGITDNEMEIIRGDFAKLSEKLGFLDLAKYQPGVS